MKYRVVKTPIVGQMCLFNVDNGLEGYIYSMTSSALVGYCRGYGHWNCNIKGGKISSIDSGGVLLGECLPRGLHSHRWEAIHSGGEGYALTMGNLTMRIKTNITSNVVHKGKRYTIKKIINNHVVKIGLKSVGISDIRIFKNSTDAKKYIDYTKKQKCCIMTKAEREKKGFKNGNYFKITKREALGMPDENSLDFTEYADSSSFSLYGIIINNYLIPYDSLKIITRKQYQDGVRKEDRGRVFRMLSFGIIANIKNELSNTENSISKLQASIIHRLRDKTELIKKLKKKDFSPFEKIEEDLKILNKYSNVERAELKDSRKISVITKDIKLLRIEDDEDEEFYLKKHLPLNMGTFQIDMDIINCVVGIKRLDNVPYLMSTHPHVGSHNTLCFGNMDNTIPKLFKVLDFLSIFDIVIEILEEVNPNGYDNSWDFINQDRINEKIKKKARR